MADEAKLRIILEDQPTSGPSRPQPGSAQTAGSSAFQQGSVPTALPSAASSVAQAAKNQAAFDPVALARERIERERREMLVRAQYQNITEGPGRPIQAEKGVREILAEFLGKMSKGGLQSALMGAGGELAAGAGLGRAGLGGLAASAGPIGAALVAADIGAKVLANTINGVTRSIQQEGEVIGAFMRNDNMGALTQQADMAAEALGKIPIVGQVWEAEIKAVTGTIRTFDKVVAGIVARGRELAIYSPDLAAAKARTDVRALLADIQEAQRLGPGQARLMERESQFNADLRETLLPLKQLFTDVATTWVEFKQLNLDTFNVLKDAFEAIDAATAGPMLRGILGELSGIAPFIRKLHDYAAKREAERIAQGLYQYDAFMKLGDAKFVPKYGTPGNEENLPRNQDLQIPAFQ